MFLCSCGENVASKLFLFPSIYRHKLVPSAFICSNHPSTTSPRHTNMLPPIAEKFRLLFFTCFSTIQTKYNSQLTTYFYLALRGTLECDLPWLVLPWGRTSAPLKIYPFWTSRSHLFLQLFEKMYRACNADQSQDNCFFVFLNCLTSSRSQKMYSHLFSVTSDTLTMKSTNCYKICPLVRIGPNSQNLIKRKQ